MDIAAWLNLIGQIVGITLIVLTGAAVLTGLVVLIVRRRRRERARRDEIARTIATIRRRMAEADDPDDPR